jgi:hypothetical protein
MLSTIKVYISMTTQGQPWKESKRKTSNEAALDCHKYQQTGGNQITATNDHTTGFGFGLFSRCGRALSSHL